jgi:hypothetical protein
MMASIGSRAYRHLLCQAPPRPMETMGTMGGEQHEHISHVVPGGAWIRGPSYTHMDGR